MLLPDTDEAGAEHVPRRLVRATPAQVGVSVGTAVSRPGESSEVLMSRADRDLYRHTAGRIR